MNLSDQVISLELAKKLKELGVNKASIFGWIYHEHSEGQAWACKHPEPNAAWYIITGSNNHKPVLWDEDNEAAAFTVAELCELLPAFINEGNYRLAIYKFTNTYSIDYCHVDTGYTLYFSDIADKTLANALAKMLIFLIENGILKND